MKKLESIMRTWLLIWGVVLIGYSLYVAQTNRTDGIVVLATGVLSIAYYAITPSDSDNNTEGV